MRLVRYLSPLVLLLLASTAAFSQVAITVNFAPPPLPVYEQPVCPGEGYIWTPGFWAYDADFDDYYWVPGTWVLAPEAGLLWTPPYWAWNGSAFEFYDGYWGPQVGFYGGIVYGFGYFGVGYEGGYWQGRTFYYNRAVTNVNVTVIHNVYNKTVVNNYRNVTRVSYNGGSGGINARPTPEQEAAARERRASLTSAQTQNRQAARSDQQFRASSNHGKPPVAATDRPGNFNGHGVVKAKEAGGPYQPPANRAQNPNSRAEADNKRATHPNDLPPLERPAVPNSSGSKAEQKAQKQQEKLYEKEEKDRQKLEQKQEHEHQQLEKQNASAEKRQQVEQRHQQQTQQLQQRHEAQQQKLERREGGSQPPHR